MSRTLAFSAALLATLLQSAPGHSADTDPVARSRDLRALGPAGEAAPAALAPGQAIPTPHFVFVPQPPTTRKTSQR